MYCNYCGYKVPDSASFCPKCGAGLIRGYNYQSARTKKPISAFFWVNIILAVLTVVALFVLYTQAQLYSSPELVAKRAFVGLVNDDKETSFAELGVEESEFVNADTYAAYNARLGLNNVTSYTITDVTDQYSQVNGYDDYFDIFDDEFGDIFEQFGIDPYEIIGENDQGEGSEQSDAVDTDDIRIYEITFNTASQSDTTQVYMTLNKTGRKQYLFFDEWEVSSDGVLASDYHVIVGAGDIISFDGQPVSAAYITKDTDDEYYAYLESEGMSDDYVVYRLPEVFVGSHDVVVSGKDIDEAQFEVYVSSDSDGVQLTDTAYSIEALSQMEKKAVENVRTIYEAACRGADFSEIDKLFTTDSDKLKEISYRYETLRDYFSDESIRALTVDAVHTAYNSDENYIRVTLDYTILYTYGYWWLNSNDPDKVRQTSSSVELRFSFTNENGDYLQDDLGCDILTF